MPLRLLRIRILADRAYQIKLLLNGQPIFAIHNLLAMWKEAADIDGLICIGSQQFQARSIQAILIEGVI